MFLTLYVFELKFAIVRLHVHAFYLSHWGVRNNSDDSTKSESTNKQTDRQADRFIIYAVYKIYTVYAIYGRIYNCFPLGLCTCTQRVHPHILNETTPFLSRTRKSVFCVVRCSVSVCTRITIGKSSLPSLRVSIRCYACVANMHKGVFKW